MDKLKVPRATMVDLSGKVTPVWERFFEQITKYLRITDLIEFGTGSAEENGNWRITQSGNDIVFQRKESGTWTTKDTISP